jgi:hypothetical protein
MATISKKISATDYEIIGDTQGVLVPQPVRFTRFRPPNIAAPDGSQSYFVAPTPAQCTVGGGEDWNSGTSTFYVPKAGIYTVSLPAFNTTNTITAITAQVTAYGTSGAIDSKSVLIGTLVDDAAVWQARDISCYVPEGGRIRIGLFTYQVPGNILFDVSAIGGIFTIYLNEVAAPYVVANRGALVSSDAVGKVKIDADDSTMSVSGELGTGTDGSKVSINRPDKWNAGIEYDFGGGLYGRRQTGSVALAAGMVLDTIIVSNFGINPFVSTGGLIQHVNQNFGAFGCIYGEGALYFSSLYVANSSLVLSLRDPQSGTAYYDVWVTYRK